jgi:hypothetical protein
MLYGLAAPLAVIALPLAILLVLARPRAARARLVAGFTGGLALWWLLGSGDLPDQTVRAGALIASVGFALLSRRTTWSVTHRALAAVTLAALGTMTCFLLFRWSWGRLHWWTEFRTGPALRLMLQSAATDRGAGGVGFGTGARGFEQMLDRLTTISADLFPALMALQLLVGLAVAAVLAHRLADGAAGVPPGRLAEFRFSEHLGWSLVLAIAALLIPGAGAAARLVALNVLVVIGTLYGLRGLAVMVFGIRALRGGLFLYLAAAAAVFFLLPGVVLLGVLDAGLNLRRRWPPPSGA